MHLSPEAIAAMLLAINAAACALVPVEVKQKAPMLWAVLDALAVNVKHATNRLDNSKPWQQALAAAVVSAILSTVVFTAQMPDKGSVAASPAAAVAGWPPVGADLPVPVSPADAATPCDDATATTDTDR